MNGPSRWSAASGVQRGADYDERWARMEAAGVSIHGEADFIGRYEPSSVLDAGCGTGRVAIELARRGVDVVGVDLDPPMLEAAREKAPDLEWVAADLRTVDLGRRFDVVAAPGNVMIFLAPGTEREVVANLARHLEPDGVLVAGFQLGGRYDLQHYDVDCDAAGLTLVERFATWEGAPWHHGGDYAVSAHRPAKA
ncbi:methyltransferase family protein [Ilumatobacter fluminis]|uniref:Methyltransferase family protein n=1 Tax=Ilumatobacter fluminis TaxID=467091 RepID=A0A4R7HWC8_9ACTN|nr:class I SAM-dependent methyltransferase [Ilumatobacter fluminis]TDT14456.1 methyltransferase family protein [Ilumatobacter fluminis]